MANYDLTYEGSRVQSILDTGDELRDAGYIFRGEATPSTVPGTPTERVAYIGGPGTYTNFGSSTVVPSGSIGVFKYTGSAWSNQVIACTVPISTTVQNNDTTVPTGKAVKAAVDAEASARQLGDSTLQGGINTVSAAVTAINNAIGNGSVYAGIATPSSTPASGKVFYLAFTAGTYTNFNSLEVPQGINILKNNGSTWLLDSFLGIDDAPTQGSANLVKSDGVLGSIIQNGPAFDLSAYNAQEGVLATYTDLNAALTALNALPSDFKKGGMSMKFVLTSDNKYVQFRCKTQSFSTNPEDWFFCGKNTLINNPEFLNVITDSQKRILWAIKKDGSIYYGAGVPQQVIDYIESRIAELSLDEYEDIVDFLDGLEVGDKTLQELLNEKVDKEENKSLIPVRYIQEIDNPEFLCLWTDNAEKIILGFKRDGDIFFGYGVPTQIQAAIRDYIGTDNNTIREYLDKTFGYYSNDPEGRMEIKTDKEKNIISYRDKNGVLHENSGIETPNADIANLNVGIFNLSPKGINEFQKILKEAGFSGDKHDYSDYISNKGKNPLHLSTPRLAYVNVTNSSNDAIWVTSKTNDFEYIVEYLDDCGNYFKKNAIGNAQGRSSLGHPKKNISLKLFDESVYNNKGKKGKGNKLAIKYGDWVPQSTFHLKAYYTDFFRGINIIAYALANMIWKSRGIRADRPYKKALIDFSEIGRDYRDAWNKDDMSLQMNNGARCIPDGFPVIAFLNGEFYGIYSWQLKKDAKNFVMEDDNPNHIHLDGVISWSVLFGADGDTSKVNWNPGEYQGFEIRNPEGLTIVNGDEYDADANTSQEPIGEDDPGYDSTNESHVLSNEVKKKILALSEVMPTLHSMRDGGSTDAEIKEYFEEHLDPNNIIDYILFSAILYNYDGFTSNWQWVTWDGIKWYICPYDCDGILGQQEVGNYIMNVNATIFRNGTASQSNPNDGFNMPIKWITTYYKTELAARWAEIKELGCVEFFMDTLIDWMSRIGQDNYEKEWKKWPDTPSNRDSNVVSEYWAFAGERSSSDAAVAATGKVFDSTRAYVPFTTTETEYNTCWFKQGYWYKLRCVKECTGVQPLNTAKSALGFHDSIWRAQNMLEHLYNGIDALITNL